MGIVGLKAICGRKVRGAALHVSRSGTQIKAIMRRAVNRFRRRAAFANAKSLQERVCQQFVRTEPGVVTVNYCDDHQFVQLKFIGNA